MVHAKYQRTIEALKITGNWKDQPDQLKTRPSRLTDEELKFEAGQENDLLSKVGTKLHKTREEVINIIKKVQAEKYNLIRDNLKLRGITPPFVNLGEIPSPFFYFICK